jgi:ribosomal 50S subunit-associated protein YjgA (DUF615 family)
MKTSFAPDSPYIDHDDLLTLTELKDQARAMTSLGKRIVNLTSKQLRRLPLEGAVRDAIMEARRLEGFSARKRQLGFVGRLLRGIDVEPLQKAVEDAEAYLPFVDPKMQPALDWTQRLVDEGTDAITDEQPDRVAREKRARAALLNYVCDELVAE